jgi:hypothetical protein
MKTIGFLKKSGNIMITYYTPPFYDTGSEHTVTGMPAIFFLFC